MELTIIDGNPPNSGWSYGVTRFLQEAAKDSELSTEAYKISDIRTEEHNKKDGVVDLTKLNVPDLVIPYDISLETHGQWPDILEWMENNGAVVVSSKESLLRSLNKITMGDALIRNNVPHPRFLNIDTPSGNPTDIRHDYKNIVQEIGAPFVVKTAYGARGDGVRKVDNINEFSTVLSTLGGDENNPLLVQKFIPTSMGKDVRAMVIGDNVAFSMLRKAKDPDEFRSNFSLGGTVTPYTLSQEEKNIAVNATKAIGLDYSGVDLLFSKQGLIVCEVNESPGFKGMEQAYPEMNIGKKILYHCIQVAQMKDGPV